METLAIPTEADFKRWIEEAVKLAFEKYGACLGASAVEEGLLNRQEAAAFLRVSLGTLSDWTKRGMTHYRQRGRVYYNKGDLLAYLRANHGEKLKYSDKYAGMGSR